MAELVLDSRVDRWAGVLSSPIEGRVVLGPNWFASVMGTGIIAIAAAILPVKLGEGTLRRMCNYSTIITHFTQRPLNNLNDVCSAWGPTEDCGTPRVSGESWAILRIPANCAAGIRRGSAPVSGSRRSGAMVNSGAMMNP